jgi:hypothetical protein
VRIYFESHNLKGEAQAMEMYAEGFQSNNSSVTINTPSEPGIYDLVAEIDYQDKAVRSIRQINILPGNDSP